MSHSAYSATEQEGRPQNLPVSCCALFLVNNFPKPGTTGTVGCRPARNQKRFVERGSNAVYGNQTGKATQQKA